MYVSLRTLSRAQNFFLINFILLGLQVSYSLSFIAQNRVMLLVSVVLSVLFCFASTVSVIILGDWEMCFGTLLWSVKLLTIFWCYLPSNNYLLRNHIFAHNFFYFILTDLKPLPSQLWSHIWHNIISVVMLCCCKPWCYFLLVTTQSYVSVICMHHFV